MKELSSLLKSRNFVRLWISQIISQVVVNFLSFLLLVYLFEITGSTVATSFIWVAYALPAVLFGPIAAVSADVVDKRRLLTVALLIQSLVVAVLAMLHNRFIYLAYGIVFAYSLANQFYIPAEAASLPLFVKKQNLPFANSLFFLTVQSAFVLGFLFAGTSFEYLGMSVSLVLASGLLLVAYSSVSLLPRIVPSEKIPKDISKGIVRFFSELIEGYQFIRNNKRVFLPFILLIGLQISLSVVVVSMPALAQDLIKIRPRLAGFVIAVPAFIGALSSTILVSRAISRGVPRKRIVEISLFILNTSLLVVGSIVPNVSFWIGRTLSVICFFTAGISYVGCLIPTLTHLQIATPSSKLGRVFGNIWFITTAFTVVPLLFSAAITEVFGVGLMMSLLGLAGMLVFFYVEISRRNFLMINK